MPRLLDLINPMIHTRQLIAPCGHGIIRLISFYNKDFMASHPEITVDKKSVSPDEDKSVHDARLLIPTL